MKSKIAILAIMAMALGMSSTIKAQTPSLIDTVYLTIENGEDSTGVTDGAFVVNVFLSLNTQSNMTGATFGITWDRYFASGDEGTTTPFSTSDWQFDSLVYQGNFANPGFWFGNPPDTGAPNHRADSLGVVVTGGLTFGGGIAPGSNLLMCKLYLSLAPGHSWAAGKSVTIDSTFAPPAGDYLMDLTSGQVIPVFRGAKIVTFNDVTLGDVTISSLPKTFGLAQNYPNPFNPSTKIEFDVPTRSHVTIEVFNVLGQRVKTLADEFLPAATAHSVTWDGDNDNGELVASGMYFYKITAGNFVQTRKMVLMK